MLRVDRSDFRMTREKLLKLLISHTTKTALCGAPSHPPARARPCPGMEFPRTDRRMNLSRGVSTRACALAQHDRSNFFGERMRSFAALRISARRADAAQAPQLEGEC